MSELTAVFSFQKETEEEEESECIFGLFGLWGLRKAMNHFVRAPEMLSLLCRGQGNAFACLESSLVSRKKMGFCPKSAIMCRHCTSFLPKNQSCSQTPHCIKCHGKAGLKMALGEVKKGNGLIY